MNKIEFSKKIIQKLMQINISFSEDKVEKFYIYMQLLLEWNKKINLTSIVEPEEIITKHFIDSLTIESYILPNSKVIDVGTGAGFPGIPLKIIREDINILLLDSLNKRIKFLDEVIDKLKLTNIKTIHCRAEEAGQMEEYREKFDIATSRAVANMNILAEYLLPFVKLGGKAIFMKGSNTEDEIRNSQKAIATLAEEKEKIIKFFIPSTNFKRNIILVDKKISTPKQYPRSNGKPIKNPL